MSLSWVDASASGTIAPRFVIANEQEYVVIAVMPYSSEHHIAELRSTDGGATWNTYDTGVVMEFNVSCDYDAIADADGVVHVLFKGSNHFLKDAKRTAWQTWSTPVTVDSTTYPSLGIGIAAGRSSSGELAVVWLVDWSVYRYVWGKKWTKANGWDANATAFYSGNSYVCLGPKIAYAGSDALLAVYVPASLSYVTFPWGGSTPTVRVTSDTSVITDDNGNMSFIVTGTTPHILWVKGADSAAPPTHPYHVFLDTTQISSGTEDTQGNVLLAQCLDGTQVLYYVTHGASYSQCAVKRAELTNGAPGTVTEYIATDNILANGGLSCPYDLPDTEGLLAAIGGASPYLVKVSHGIPIASKNVHSFPWVGRFQLCKVTA